MRHMKERHGERCVDQPAVKFFEIVDQHRPTYDMPVEVVAVPDDYRPTYAMPSDVVTERESATEGARAASPFCMPDVDLDDLLADIPEPALTFRLLGEDSDTDQSTTIDSDIIEYPPKYPAGCEENGVWTLVPLSPKDIPLEATDSMPDPRVKTYVGQDTVIDTIHHHTEGLVYERQRNRQWIQVV